MRLAEDLRQRVAQAPLWPEGSVTVSIGVAAQRPGLDTGAWMRVTDEALYEAKRSGRNRVVMAD
jgi:diguanylate cyclase (GGDEF)-like protein